MEKYFLELLRKNGVNTEVLNWSTLEDIYKTAVDYSEIHVKRALQKASKNVRIKREDGSSCISFGGSGFWAEIDKHSITNSYHRKDIEDYEQRD